MDYPGDKFADRAIETRAMDEAKIRDMRVAREITVGELLDRRIEKAGALLHALHDLKGSLPGQFLSSGASRISAFIEL